jgi:hypothetical protein
MEVFDYNFYFYRHNNGSAMTKHYTLKNVMSNASVTEKWFYKIDEVDKIHSNVVKRRLSEDMISCIRFLNMMSSEDKITFEKYLNKQKPVMDYTHNWLYRTIYRMSKLIGFMSTADLWGIIRKQ